MSLGPSRPPTPGKLADARVVIVCIWATALAMAAGVIAQGLIALIDLITNLSFYGEWSFAHRAPSTSTFGFATMAVPVVGALVVGVMARFGAKSIRGHGIPEVIERILSNESRIPARLVFLKPLSAAIAIGTGGPFGAEGPIIATGGALGSLIGQITKVTADERKTLLAAGAAAGMAATFGSPVSAVLLAVELLLFEYRPRSMIPVALAAGVADAVRVGFVGAEPVFEMPHIAPPGGTALASYIAVGALVGLASVIVTRATYWMEDAFERLPVHWMWWPAIGAVVVGAVGLIEPRTLGVGYFNIEETLTGELAGQAALALCLWKLLSWSVALSSGTSGGTLAPLLTVGGALGSLLGALAVWLLPAAGVDPRVAALVGMAAMFTGASRAMLASIVFAFEVTWQPMGLLPLLGGCAAAFLVSCLMMRESIMTEKIARRGGRVVGEYAADWLSQVAVRACCTHEVTWLEATQTVEDAREWLRSGAAGSHQGFPVIDAQRRVVGVVTRREIEGALPAAVTVLDLVRRPPAVVREDDSAREAADHMIAEKVGRLPVVDPEGRLVGILTRSDLLRAHEDRLTRAKRAQIVRPIRVRDAIQSLRDRFTPRT